MSGGFSTRRQMLASAFLLGAGAEIGEALQHAHQAVRQGFAVQSLPPEMAKEVEALVCQIIPSGDGPGARETGVIHFIDRALGTFAADQKDLYLRSMGEVQEVRRKMFPESASIAGLTDVQQIALVHAIEKTPFFGTLRTHTVMGFLGSPEYGGNQGSAGWAHIGFEDKMAFDPPFGAYDAAAERGGQ